MFWFFGKEGCWDEMLAVGFHKKREILLMTTCLHTDSVLTALYVVSKFLTCKLWGIVYFADIFILLALFLACGYSVYNQKVLFKLMEQRIYFYELM